MYWVSTPSISTTTACRSVSAAQDVVAHPAIRIPAVIMLAPRDRLDTCRNTFIPSLRVGDRFEKIVRAARFASDTCRDPVFILHPVACRKIVVSQFETMATQSPPIHRAGGAGPWETRSDCLAHRPPVGCRYACPDVRRRVSQGPTPPARPLRGAHGRIDDPRGEALVRDRKRVRAPNLPTTGLSAAGIVGQFPERPSLPDSAARAPRGGRERRVGLRKPVVVRRDRRPADRHSGGRLAGPIGFPKAHPSLPPGERAVRVRTETLPNPGNKPRPQNSTAPELPQFDRGDGPRNPEPRGRQRSGPLGPRASEGGRSPPPSHRRLPMRARLRRATPVRKSMPGSVVPKGKKSDSSEDISAWAVEGVWSTASSNTIRSATALRIGDPPRVDPIWL